MRPYIWVAAVVCLAVVDCRSLIKRDVDSEAIDPAIQEVDSNDQFRDKRKVEESFGIKNAVLGFVFNPKNTQNTGFAWDKPKTTTKKTPTTTEDIVIFEKNQKVELDLPDELFGSGFTLLTNVSTTVGDFMINSALRTQRLLESMRPFLRAIFGAKGIVIEATTDKPIFSAPDASRR